MQIKEEMCWWVESENKNKNEEQNSHTETKWDREKNDAEII